MKVKGVRSRVKDRYHNVKASEDLEVSSREGTARGSSVMAGFTPFQSGAGRNPESFYNDTDAAKELDLIGIDKPTDHYTLAEAEKRLEAKRYYKRNSGCCAQFQRLLRGKSRLPGNNEIARHLDKDSEEE